MRRSTWICLDDCQAPFVAHLQSPWGASGKPRSWRRFPDKRYRGPTGATRSTVYLPSLSHSSRPTVPPSSTPGSPLYPHTTALHLRCRDRDSDRGRGVTTATMPGETSDGGGEDINGGQGRHIESLSLIFAQRRCEFFLLARKVAAQGWCLGFAYRHERFRGYCWHASSPVHLIRLSSSLSLCIRTYFVFVFVTTRSWFSHSLEEAARDMVKTMRGYARRKRFTKTCGNRACMIARR